MQTPPVLSGSAENQARQIYNYLFQLVEKLNVTLEAIEGTPSDASSRLSSNGRTSPGGGGQGGGSSADTYEELKALIANTAQYAKTELTVLQNGLQQTNTTVSENWGTYQEQYTNISTQTAALNEQSLQYAAELSTHQEALAGFSSYQISTEGFIRQGFIEVDGGLPIIGIAIGQDATTSVTQTIDGIIYHKVDTSKALAMYTAEKISFWLNGAEVAYISNHQLYINTATVQDIITLGQFELKSSPSTGLSIKWVGA